MPVVVIPGETTAPPVQAESPDHRLRVISHPAGGGVFLRADFSDLNPTPRKVRFVRGRDQLPVRSGHDAWAPGGVAKAYDREAPGGVPSAWYAIPIFWINGSYVAGTMSQGAQVVAPSVDQERDFWIKSIQSPKQMRLQGQGPDPEGSMAGRDAGQEVPGSMFLAGGWDVPIWQPVTYRFRTYTTAEFRQLQQLVAAGPMLVQTLPLYGIPDEYFKLGSMAWSYTIGAFDPRRNVSLTLNPCRRPPTEHAPLYVPGHSWEDGKAAYLSWDHAASFVDTWDDLLITAPPIPESIIPETGDGGDEGGP